MRGLPSAEELAGGRMDALGGTYLPPKNLPRREANDETAELPLSPCPCKTRFNSFSYPPETASFLPSTMTSAGCGRELRSGLKTSSTTFLNCPCSSLGNAAMSFNRSRINILSLVTAMMARAFSGVKGPERGTTGTTGVLGVTGAFGAPETRVSDASLAAGVLGVRPDEALGAGSRDGMAAGVKPGLSPFG